MKASIVAIALVAASPAQADDVDRWRSLIADASVRCGVPTSWIERVMRAESAGSTTLDGRPIRSRVGAMGLMQLMPKTWDAMRVRLSLGDDPDDPHDNILAGTCYMRMMYDQFGYPGLFAAYNAGPARYASYLAGKQALPDETVAYLHSLAGSSVTATTPPPSIFAVRRDAAPVVMTAITPASSAPAPATVFAIRKVDP